MVLALTGLTTLVVAAGAERETKANVRSVHGKVSFKYAADEAFKPLKVNQDLKNGAILKSEAGAEAFLQVNGLTSTVKLTESTTITLEKMVALAAGDSSTLLSLERGTVLGSVRKLPATSEYNVKVPNGVAGIRGTDFQVTVTYTGGGNFTVTFTSVTGTVVCQVTLPPGGIPNATQTQSLSTGQSWTFTGSINTTTGGVTTLTINAVGPTPPAVLAAANAGITIINNLPPPSVPPPPATPPPYVPPPPSLP